MSERFFFVHLQKTAGTALLRRLRHHFGEEHVYPLRSEQGTAEVVLDVDRLASRVEATGERFRVVTGHFPYAAVHRLPGRWSTFTVLRDPVERVLSFLRHQREVEPRFTTATLDEIYDHPLSTGPLVSNHMVRMLSLRRDELTDGALSPVTLDRSRLDDAMDTLTERIDVWGVQEHFEDFCADLETTFGWDLGPPLYMNRTTPEEAPSALRERVGADNALDVELYDLARRRWEAGRRGHQTSGI